MQKNTNNKNYFNMTTEQIVHISDNVLVFLSICVVLTFIYRLAKDKGGNDE